ncbi:MAG: MBL fold metallo-hydrolase [Candidatus Aureabacteria bacterium]|nr:MBL fold metallo-hydrolase [Candidatus Auribacterota bacterium]
MKYSHSACALLAGAAAWVGAVSWCAEVSTTPVAQEIAVATSERSPAPAAAGSGKESEPAQAKQPAGPHPDLEVIFFSVGDGDSALISTPGGTHVLIDGGPGRSSRESSDPAEEVILPYLRKKGITRLDLVIATHPHSDHIGGLVTILYKKEIAVDCFLDPGVAYSTRTYERLLALIKERKIPYKIGRAGQKLNLGEGIDAEIVNPPKIFAEVNDCSIVVHIKYGDISFLFTGDASEKAEALMKSKYGRALASTVLKVGHHGSSSSTSRGFLNLVQPKIAVISSRQILPSHKTTFTKLKGVGAKAYLTGEVGTIVMTTDGKKLKVSTEKG